MNDFEEEFTFVWKIENFSMLPHRKGERIVSPSFVVECLDKTKWNIWLYPKGDPRNESDNYLSLFLCRSDWDTNKTASKLSFTLALESVNSEFEKSILTRNITIDMKLKGDGVKKFEELKTVYDNLPLDILTIRCQIWPSEEKCNTPAITTDTTTRSHYFENRCSVRTIIDVQRRVLTWPITKISKLEKSQKKIFINLANSLEDFPALKLSFCINKTLNNEHAKIEILQTRSSSKSDLFVKCKITVVTANKKYKASDQDSHLFSSNLNEIWYFPNFILIDNIEEYAYVDDTMFLHCEFTFSRRGSERHLELPIYMPMAFTEKEHSSKSTKLSKNAQILFESKKFCDIQLQAGDQTFPCHKFVLCAQSPVFSAMFENNMKEKETGVVEITDLEPQTLEKMIKFLYFEIIEDGLAVEDIYKLYSAGDKYEVLLLQRRCSLLLLSKLSVENVSKVLVTADSHQDYFLQSHVNKFLNIHSREVFHSPEWKTFMVDNPILWRETMFKICMEEPCV